MKSFKQYFYEKAKVGKKINLFEHVVYKKIPSSQSSYRLDSGNTNTMTIKHSQVYTKARGRGKKLYSVNIDGSGHDGCSGMKIPSTHADFFRAQGYDIKDDNILECVLLKRMNPADHVLLFLPENKK